MNQEVLPLQRNSLALLFVGNSLVGRVRQLVSLAQERLQDWTDRGSCLG